MVRIPTLTWLALRNLGREMRRSALTAAAMAMGLALLIFSRTLANGMHEDWIDSGVGLGSGHVTFHAPGYRDSESLDDRMSVAQVEASVAAVARAEVPEPALASVRVATRGPGVVARGCAPGVYHRGSIPRPNWRSRSWARRWWTDVTWKTATASTPSWARRWRSGSGCAPGHAWS